MEWYEILIMIPVVVIGIHLGIKFKRLYFIMIVGETVRNKMHKFIITK